MHKDYGSNCEYIRKTFGLPQSASIYDVVSVITKAYKELYETTQMAQAKTEESVECQKPRVRKSKKF